VRGPTVQAQCHKVDVVVGTVPIPIRVAVVVVEPEPATILTGAEDLHRASMIRPVITRTNTMAAVVTILVVRSL
jgi:hypothetical protein